MEKRERLTQYVLRYQNGDTAALNDLFNECYQDVYYFALKAVKDSDLACDITQETFIEIQKTIGNLKEPAAFMAWVKQITYHQCTRYFRKTKDVLVAENEDGSSVFDTLEEDNADFIPAEAMDQQHFRQTIIRMVNALTDEQRTAVMMYYFDELSVKQIAEIQGVSEGTVKSRLNYARKAIKASVEEYEEKHQIKLHSFGIVPFMLWLLNGDKIATAISATSAATIAEGVSTATGISVSATATVATTGVTATASSAATVGATAVAATTAKTVGGALALKITAGVAAAAIAVTGGTVAVVKLTSDKDEDADSDHASVSETVDTDHANDNGPQEYADLMPHDISEYFSLSAMGGGDMAVTENDDGDHVFSGSSAQSIMTTLGKQPIVPIDLTRDDVYLNWNFESGAAFSGVQLYFADLSDGSVITESNYMENTVGMLDLNTDMALLGQTLTGGRNQGSIRLSTLYDNMVSGQYQMINASSFEINEAGECLAGISGIIVYGTDVVLSELTIDTEAHYDLVSEGGYSGGYDDGYGDSYDGGYDFDYNVDDSFDIDDLYDYGDLYDFYNNGEPYDFEDFYDMDALNAML